MDRHGVIIVLLLAVCLLVQSAQSKVPRQCDCELDAEKYPFQLIRGEHEVKYCKNGDFCYCKNREVRQCVSLILVTWKYNEEGQVCDANFDCNKIYHPTTPAPTSPTTPPTIPSTLPTTIPTTEPTTNPTTEPTTNPTTEPTTNPTTVPTTTPTEPPTTPTVPTTVPSSTPTSPTEPSTMPPQPTTVPSTLPTTELPTPAPWPPMPAPRSCLRAPGRILIPEPWSCSHFIRCTLRFTWPSSCPDGKWFSYQRQACVRPAESDCAIRTLRH